MKPRIFISIILLSCIGFNLFSYASESGGKRAVFVSDFSDDFETFKKELAERYKVSPSFGIMTHKELTDPIFRRGQEMARI